MAIAHLADNRGIVVAAYILAFFPWGMMYLRCFLKPHCKFQGNSEIARRTFLIQSITCLPGLAYLVFYIHLQRITDHYQETCLAIYAAMFVLVHILKTILMFVHRNDEHNVKSDPALASV